MAKALVIVESPAKIKTLRKFLGTNYFFESSVGHIRDLPQKEFGIDIEHDFEPKYVTLPDKKEVIKRLQEAAKAADIVYLSPDPDREGEAIAWHIAAILPKETKIKRVTFNEITKDAVLEALKHPREIDISLVDAQQARRLLDRIVGYKISPILMRRVQGSKGSGLSAGRVQSVALKLVVDREKEIQAFIPVEYWKLGVLLQTDEKTTPFRAELHSVDGKKIGKEPSPNALTIPNEKEAKRHFGFGASRTMGIAQSLYEGIDLGKDGQEGLISYMRTDSVRLSHEAISAARKYIQETFGPEYLPIDGRQFTAKKQAQDAHEAIRPTAIHHTPESIRKYLTEDQFKLYSLIWKRTVACQMNT